MANGVVRGVGVDGNVVDLGGGNVFDSVVVDIVVDVDADVDVDVDVDADVDVDVDVDVCVDVDVGVDVSARVGSVDSCVRIVVGVARAVGVLRRGRPVPRGTNCVKDERLLEEFAGNFNSRA